MVYMRLMTTIDVFLKNRLTLANEDIIEILFITNQEYLHKETK